MNEQHKFLHWNNNYFKLINADSSKDKTMLYEWRIVWKEIIYFKRKLKKK
jgi:hypothetical protein